MLKHIRLIQYTLLIPALSMPAWARGPDCTADGTGMTTGCQFTKMPLLDQTDEAIDPEHDDWLPFGGNRSMLCGPVSGVMTVDAALNHADQPVRVTGWTATNYLPEDWIGRLKALGRKFLTDAKTGTALPLSWPYAEIGRHVFVNNREAGKAIGEVVWPRATNETLSRNLKWGYAQTLAYGHYEKQVARILGQEIITFGRKGGHYVALQGYVKNRDKTLLAINNPWGAVREYRTTEPLSSGIRWRGWFRSTLTIVPHVFGTGYTLYREGNQYKFIDGYFGLGVNPER